jgi:hypothetical protein
MNQTYYFALAGLIILLYIKFLLDVRYKRTLDMSKYNYYAYWCGVPVYINTETGAVAGRGQISEWFVVLWALNIESFLIWLCSFNTDYEPEFKIFITKPLENNNQTPHFDTTLQTQFDKLDSIRKLK